MIKPTLKKDKVGVTIIPDSKTYYETTVIRTVCYWHEEREVDQQVRTESTESDSHTYRQVLFNKGAKGHSAEAGLLVNKWCCENCISKCKQNKTERTPLIQTSHHIQNEHETDHRLKYKIWNYKTFTGKHRKNIVTLKKDFLDTKAWFIKEKNW